MAETKASVYKMDEFSWFVTNLDFEATVEWYQKNITDLSEDEIEEIEECDIEKDGMWYITENEDDINRIGESDELLSKESIESRKNHFGDLLKRCDEVFKYTSFADVIAKIGEFNEPYEIATTEW